MRADYVLARIYLYGGKELRISISIAWYDFRVGFFWDTEKKILYFCPVPCVVIRIEKRTNPRNCSECFPGKWAKCQRCDVHDRESQDYD